MNLHDPCKLGQAELLKPGEEPLPNYRMEYVKQVISCVQPPLEAYHDNKLGKQGF